MPVGVAEYELTEEHGEKQKMYVILEEGDLEMMDTDEDEDEEDEEDVPPPSKSTSKLIHSTDCGMNHAYKIRSLAMRQMLNIAAISKIKIKDTINEKKKNQIKSQNSWQIRAASGKTFNQIVGEIGKQKQTGKSSETPTKDELPYHMSKHKLDELLKSQLQWVVMIVEHHLALILLGQKQSFSDFIYISGLIFYCYMHELRFLTPAKAVEEQLIDWRRTGRRETLCKGNWLSSEGYRRYDHLSQLYPEGLIDFNNETTEKTKSVFGTFNGLV
ncbi:hypothetical protein ACOMHN_014244 [Nucella lapillus]